MLKSEVSSKREMIEAVVGIKQLRVNDYDEVDSPQTKLTDAEQRSIKLVRDEELELLQQRKIVEEEKIKVLQQLHRLEKHRKHKKNVSK